MAVFISTHFPLASSMAFISGFFTLFMFLLSAEARNQQNKFPVISLDSQLSPNTSRSWLSPSGHFAFGFYPQGNGHAIGIWLVGHPENTVVWTANRDDPPVSVHATIVFTRDGKLLLRTEQREEKLIANVTSPADSAAMLDSGNFVLFSNSSVIWQSFDFPTDTLLGGQNLSYGMELVSSVSISDHSSGKYLLVQQTDRNLVAYPINTSHLPTDAYWASNIFNYGMLSLNQTGFLYLASSYVRLNAMILASSSYPCENKQAIYRATLDIDGIFRLYSHCIKRNNSTILWHIEWSSLDNKCKVHGICGLNSYCSGTGAGTVTYEDCFCYPGFDFIDPNDKSNGCYKKIRANACTHSKEPVKMYDVFPLENMWWGESCYSALRIGKDNCRLSCLEDCQCEAALYLNGTCEKYALPLRYGRANKSISSTAFFKINAHPAPSSPPPPISPIIVVESKESLILRLASSLGSIACLSLVIAAFTFFMYRHRANLYRGLPGAARLAGDFTLQSFSYDDIVRDTDGFNEELGRGSIGVVYKGNLSLGNRIVAVKRLEKVADEGVKEFQAEITVIGQTHHRNLVRLLGFCAEGSKKLLVYEYMKNGSLADLLFKSKTLPIWKERMRIALDVARGMHYLHEECEAQIIHCNITPKNILLDDSWTAKISDFGLAKLLYPDEMRSSFGFMDSTNKAHAAPEWQNDALISVKVDIFSYGVVLLEIICCRRSIEVDVSTADEIILSSWVYECYVAGKLDKIVEGEDIDYKTLERTLKVGLWCVQDDPELRPSTKNVILMLEGTVDVPVPPSPTLSLEA